MVARSNVFVRVSGKCRKFISLKDTHLVISGNVDRHCFQDRITSEILGSSGDHYAVQSLLNHPLSLSPTIFILSRFKDHTWNTVLVLCYPKLLTFLGIVFVVLPNMLSAARVRSNMQSLAYELDVVSGLFSKSSEP